MASGFSNTVGAQQTCNEMLSPFYWQIYLGRDAMMHTYLEGESERKRNVFTEIVQSFCVCVCVSLLVGIVCIKLFSNSLFRFIIRHLLEGKSSQTHSNDPDYFFFIGCSLSIH